jgi:parvulin-like peptidyl-prolyl isomerase
MSPTIWPSFEGAVRIFRSPLRWTAVALALACGISLMAEDRPDAPKVVEEIIAKVNGNIVTRGQLEKDRAQVEAEIRRQAAGRPDLEKMVEQAGKDQLRNEIDQLLLVQKGKDMDIKVDDDLKRTIAGYQSESRIADPEKFHEYIRNATGMSFEDFQQKQKDTLITQRVVGDQVWRNIVIPEAKLREYYDAHKTDFVRVESVTLREILISTGDDKPETVAAAKKKAEDLLKRARGSADKFSDLARQYSDAPSAVDEGLLPYPYERGKGADPNRQLNKAIEDIVFNHEKGYVTDVIQIRGVGFAIYKVEDHIPAGQATFDDVRYQINNILAGPIAEPKLREFLTSLRRDAFLQIKPGYVDTGAAPGKDTAWKDPARLQPQTTTKAEVANQRHLKKFLHIIPYGWTGEKDEEPAAPPTVTPVPQTPPTTNSDGSPR